MGMGNGSLGVFLVWEGDADDKVHIGLCYV